MAIYKVKLKKKETVAEGTMAFHFEKPSGFEFQPGQFGDYTVLNPPETDAEGNIRSFSFAGSPDEPDLLLATRMRDTAFKRVLKAMPHGTEIQLEGPSGDFTLHRDSSRPAVFLAGGIGITPFRSMILHAGKARLAHRLLLIYSNRRPEDAAFLHELEAADKQNPNFKLIATMTDMSKSKEKWAGRTGQLDKKMLAECTADLKHPIYYVAGPPAMVKAISQLLSDSGVKEADVRSDSFDGY
jgi:ferredoxin-NADP reductase